MNKNFLYKINLKRKKPKLVNASDLLLQLASPTYILSSDTDITDLDLVELEDGEYGHVEESENVEFKTFQGFRICQSIGKKLRSTYVPWLCCDGEERRLDIVYFSNTTEGLFIKIHKSEGFILKKVLNKDNYSLDIDVN